MPTRNILMAGLGITVFVLVVIGLAILIKIMISRNKVTGKNKVRKNGEADLRKPIIHEVKNTNKRFDHGELKDFLNRAFEAYVTVFTKKNVDSFKKFATPTLVYVIMGKVKYNRLEFGLPSHRSVTWDFVNTSGIDITMKMSLRFTKTFDIGKTPTKLGQDRFEWWRITVQEDGSFVVEEIIGGN